MSWIEIVKVQTASKTAAEECSRYMCTLLAQKNTLLQIYQGTSEIQGNIIAIELINQ
jgi:hypothetical protein